MIEIKLKHLSLRTIRIEDTNAIFNYRSDAETNKYQSWIPKTLNDVAKFINMNPKKFNRSDTWYQLVIIEEESGTLIGDLGIHFIDEHQVELGVTLAKKHHGCGYATEALKLIINYLFNTLKKHRITCSIDPKNVNSKKLMERLGFRKEAHFKESLLIDGEWVDDIIYAVLRKEWK